MPAISLSPELLAFARQQLSLRSHTLASDTRLQADLGVDGEDGTDFIEAFAKAFGVELAGFDATRYFGPEAGFNPIGGLWRLLFGPRLEQITLARLQTAATERRWQPSSHV